MKQDKRENLISSAIELFARDGINGTTTGAVAKAAGVATGTLFNYFPTKEDLIKSAYKECKVEVARHLKEGLEAGANFETVLKQAWTRGLEWSLANPDKHTFMHVVKRSPEIFDAALEKELQQEWSFFSNAMDKAREEGRIYPIDPGYLMLTFGALFDAAVQYASNLKKKERPAFQEKSFEFVLQALKVK